MKGYLNQISENDKALQDIYSNYLVTNKHIKSKQSGVEQAYNNLIQSMAPPREIKNILGQPYWQTWIEKFFPKMVNGYGKHHINFWEYFNTLRPKNNIDSRVLIWSRSLGKSSTIEMAVARAIAERRRFYIWYVSATQDQAEQHIETISLLIKSSDILEYYPQLKTIIDNTKMKRFNNGVVLEAIWIMGKNRGKKNLEQRPDLIVLDDVEDRDDTILITKKKKNRVVSDILSAGANNTVVWFAQNQIHEYSIASEFVRNEHDFLTGSKIDIVQAIDNFKIYKKPMSIPYEKINIGNEVQYITGQPTSPHFTLKHAAVTIGLIGLIPFRVEYQHEVDILLGDMFTPDHFRYAKHLPFCTDIKYVRYWDKGATEGGGSFTCGVLMARLKYGNDADQSHYYVVDVVRGQWEGGKRDIKIKEVGIKDLKEYGDKIDTWIEQEPGGGGKDSASATLRFLRASKKDDFGRILEPAIKRSQADRVDKSKGKRAEPLQTQAKLGNLFVFERGWTKNYIRMLCKLQKENLTSQGTDELDASSGAFNALSRGGWSSK